MCCTGSRCPRAKQRKRACGGSLGLHPCRHTCTFVAWGNGQQQWQWQWQACLGSAGLTSFIWQAQAQLVVATPARPQPQPRNNPLLDCLGLVAVDKLALFTRQQPPAPHTRMRSANGGDERSCRAALTARPPDLATWECCAPCPHSSQSPGLLCGTGSANTTGGSIHPPAHLAAPPWVRADNKKHLLDNATSNNLLISFRDSTPARLATALQCMDTAVLNVRARCPPTAA